LKPQSSPNAPWTAEEIVFSQGYGTRKECRQGIRSGRYFFAPAQGDERPLTLKDQLHPQGGTLRSGDISLPWLENIQLILNKPKGLECSHRPQHHGSVFDLLPTPWVHRGLEAAGRLDVDTTGLLLFGTDGQWLHQFTSPRKHIAKIYRVRHETPLTEADIRRLSQGFILKGETTATLPAQVEILEPTWTRLHIQEGRYHQVKRMFAAIGNPVLELHRESVGEFHLPPDLPEGKWRLIGSPA
jgi:16S rRNA pseudouridine516 synthase